VFNRFHKNKAKAIQWIRNSFLTSEMKEAYAILLEERYARIYVA